MVKKYSFLVIFFLFFSVVPFYFLAYPSLMGEIDIQAYSDALTYERLAKEDFDEQVNIAFNLLGPITILKFLNYNYIFVYIFNCLVFFIFINPMTLFALFSVNKEILLFLDVILLLIFLKSRNIFLFVFIMLFSYFIKWQMLLFVLAVYGLLLCEKIYKNRLLYLFGILLFLSIAFPLLLGLFENVIAVSFLDTDKVSGSGIFPKLIELQSQPGGYILAFPLKIMQLLFGLIGRSYLLFDWSDFWNNFVQTIFSFTFFFLSTYLIYKKRINIQNDILYIAIVFSLIFALSPIFSVRYFYPLYILLSVLVSQKLEFKK